MRLINSKNPQVIIIGSYAGKILKYTPGIRPSMRFKMARCLKGVGMLPWSLVKLIERSYLPRSLNMHSKECSQDDRMQE